MQFSSFVALALAGLAGSAAADYTITVYNKCPYTVWPGAFQTNFGNIQPFVEIAPKFRGTKLASGAKWPMTVPSGAVGLRLWARTGCPTSGGDMSKCAVGACGAGVQCTDAALTQKITVAEFGAGQKKDGVADMTFYDISKIQGMNVGVEIKPSVASCETKRCGPNSCAANQGWNSAGDTKNGSPADTGCAASANYQVTFCGA